jgi:hypothetical protein
MYVIRRPGLVVAVGVVLFAMADAARAGGPAAPSADRIEGEYRFVGGHEEVAAVERSIDDAVEEMSFLIRGLARRRLREPNLPTRELSISLDEGRITVSRNGQPAISGPQGGEEVEWRNPNNGNKLRVRYRLTDAGTLEQRLVGDRGLSVNRYVLGADGATLTVHTTITAEQLSDPLRFSTTYVRSE